MNLFTATLEQIANSEKMTTEFQSYLTKWAKMKNSIINGTTRKKGAINHMIDLGVVDNAQQVYKANMKNSPATRLLFNEIYQDIAHIG